MSKPILLVNPNRMLPPIAPIGLEYVAASLKMHGYEPRLCDLTFADDWAAALAGAIDEHRPEAIGFSIRNIDDAYFASQDFILERTAAMVRHAMTLTSRPVVLGGVGFSAAALEVLAFTGAPYGIAGDGERAFPQLLDCLARGGDPADVPGAVYRDPDGRPAMCPPISNNLSALPVPARTLADNPRYYAAGGQAGVETLRGCGQACIYCIDPLAKGRHIRVRPPDTVAAEIEQLVDMDITTFHLCDCEFNLAPDALRALCATLVRRGLARRIRWYAYGSITPFDDELAACVRAAGCAGIDFGADHGDPVMLRRLNRSHTPDDIRRTARACRAHGISVMFDTLLGAPGETRDSIAAAIALMDECGVDRVGLSCGVRVYPGTALARQVHAQGPMRSNPHLHGAVEDNADFLRPVFYVDAAIGPEIFRHVAGFVRGDRRFLHTDPAELDGNYNYNDNTVLASAIEKGARGAYWDILRRIADGLGGP